MFDIVEVSGYNSLIMKLKREPTKYVRDKAKGRYVKATACRICGTNSNLDFHHYNSVTTLLTNWIAKTGVNPNDVLEWRDRFIAEHDAELYEYTVTLCRKHHLLLHSIYGKEPALITAPKQLRWVNIQKDKHELANQSTE